MSRFYFHILDGKNALDSVGTELADLTAVRREAILVAREVILQSDGSSASVWTGHPSHLWVTDGADGTGETVLTLNIAAGSEKPVLREDVETVLLDDPIGSG